MDSESRRAIVLRICVSWTSSKSPAACGIRAAGAAAAGRAPSRSRFTIRPPGPLPWRLARSSPCSLAMRRASGEVRTRPPGSTTAGAPAPRAGACGAGAPATFCCGGIEASPCASSFARGTGLAPAVSCAVATTFSGAGAPAAGAAAPPADATSASMFSSAAAMTPMREPTAAVLSSASSRLRSTPSPRATSSITALSVSTSARTSPLFTASPSFLSHFTSRPSSMVGESASMNTFVAMPGLSRGT